MSKTEKFYKIDSFERLMPTGDANKYLVRYITADDAQGTQNLINESIEVNLSRTVITVQHLEDKNEQAEAIITYIDGKIRNAMEKGIDIPAEMPIRSYDSDIPVKPYRADSIIGKWQTVIIERKMGFKSS